jgi:hypothetical protein
LSERRLAAIRFAQAFVALWERRLAAIRFAQAFVGL